MAKKKTSDLRIAKVPLIVVHPEKLKPALKPIVEPVVDKLDRHENLLMDLKTAITKLQAQMTRLRANRRRS